MISALYRKDEATKKQTQQQLYAIIREHWEGHGGMKKFWASVPSRAPSIPWRKLPTRI